MGTNAVIAIAPGLFIMITVLCFNMVGDALRDAMDPKLRGTLGKKGKGKKKKGRMLFFSLSGGLFSLQKKEEIQWFQGKEKGKKKEKKDEVLGLEDGILGAG